MGLGMAGAAVAGVTLGAVLPTAWLFGEGGDEAEEAKSCAAADDTLYGAEMGPHRGLAYLGTPREESMSHTT
eukprot:CAMPEP_0185435686 /NCGR_PEP_ID=MMETSP1365-20130426/25232_1 /TAXON_ID=38817 /ORGANISM="Gephyrocapsa oceanica, Strain RCC1303" /LENGTH=71 /DNA_ID=CAMNT_0028040351 /DNA_START=212 /DNA_END=428 /DNA_ORIENTATION=+